MPVFWHTSPPESRASACLGLSLFIFINGNSLPVLFDFIRSASAWDIYFILTSLNIYIYILILILILHAQIEETKDTRGNSG